MDSKRNGIKVDFEPDPATWTATEEKIFIQLMVKEVQKGNRSTTTFLRKGWKNIEQEFHERTSKRYNKTQFRNKFNQLRTRYQDFSKLLQEPGFSWDPVLNTVTAAKGVWESYIKVNRKAKRFRKKGCPMFNELVVIFNDSTLKYKDVFPLAQYPMVNEDNLDLEDSSTNATPSAFPCNSSEGKGYPSQNTRRRQRSPTPTSHVGGKREARMVEMGEALKEWTEVTRAMTPTTSTLNKTDMSALSSAFSITNCVKCLESIEGLDGATYLKAIKMFKDVDWREMFMAMSSERRLIWLASLE